MNDILIPIILGGFFAIPVLLIGLTLEENSKQDKGYEIMPGVYVKDYESIETRWDTIRECDTWLFDWNHINLEMAECSSTFRSLCTKLENTDPKIGDNELKIALCKRDTTIVLAKLDSLTYVRDKLSKDKRRYSNNIDHIVLKFIIKPKEQQE